MPEVWLGHPFSGDMSMMILPSHTWESWKWESKIWAWVSRDSDPRMYWRGPAAITNNILVHSSEMELLTNKLATVWQQYGTGHRYRLADWTSIVIYILLWPRLMVGNQIAQRMAPPNQSRSCYLMTLRRWKPLPSTAVKTMTANSIHEFCIKLHSTHKSHVSHMRGFICSALYPNCGLNRTCVVKHAIG